MLGQNPLLAQHQHVLQVALAVLQIAALMVLDQSLAATEELEPTVLPLQDVQIPTGLAQERHLLQHRLRLRPLLQLRHLHLHRLQRQLLLLQVARTHLTALSVPQEMLPLTG